MLLSVHVVVGYDDEMMDLKKDHSGRRTDMFGGRTFAPLSNTRKITILQRKQTRRALHLCMRSTKPSLMTLCGRHSCVRRSQEPLHSAFWWTVDVSETNESNAVCCITPSKSNAPPPPSMQSGAEPFYFLLTGQQYC